MAITDLQNPGWETGDTTGWDIVETVTGTGFVGVRAKDPYEGTYIYSLDGTSGAFNATAEGLNKTQPAVSPGVEITAKMWFRRSGGAGKASSAKVILRWYDSVGAVISTSEGATYTTSEVWINGQVRAEAPAGAASVRAGFWCDAQEDGDIRCDLLTWDYVNNAEASLVNPPDGAVYSVTDVIPLSVELTGTEPVPFSVTYKAGTTTIGSSSVAPFSTNSPALAAGTYSITAEVTYDNLSVVITDPHVITVEAAPPAPTTREFKASNSYAYMIAESISGISSAIPSIARITAAEAVVDYTVTALVRSKDLDIDDPAVSNPNVAFDITDGGTLQMIMVDHDGETYTKLGSKYEAAIALERPDFVVAEEGTSEGKKWTVFEGNTASTTIGSDVDLFGLNSMAATDFMEKGFAFRFIPNLLAKPSYADSGDAVFRFNIDKLRIRVYFDAGSVDYYFASPDKTHVVKGHLVSAEVTAGNLETADASGVLQLASDLEVVDGTGVEIGCDYTIHAGYPVTDANQIGEVACGVGATSGMAYNGLPTQQQVRDNRSRYVMISANFYGDKDLNSIYGANGLSRGFAFNTQFFYKIFTQPDETKDHPRHVAEYHQHLALGYDDGRVDISVAGKPYSFSGLLGASSWATGDSVTGLLKLSGTILGVYGTKSITGISGTTVDNFATQTLSPNIGATEYTVTDMGFPVHANAYGVYTLSQVQQYGDYMGTPMSADISPWLRPRLLRKITSDKEVVVAWPVRSKNQYRLAFSDGYVVSMTLNGQAVPTFSFQKYFYDGGGAEPYISDDLYSYPAIVPAAVSSELDESGEERIHIAPYADEDLYVPPTPPPPSITLLADIGEGSTIYSNNWPEGYDRTQPVTVLQDGTYVGTIMAESTSSFRYNLSRWFVDDGFAEDWVPPLELQQGDWSVPVSDIDANPHVFAFRPSQKYPITSYWETELDFGASGWNSAFPLQVELDGQTHTMTYENINGTFGYVYEEGFPEGIIAFVTAQVTNGAEVYEAYITSVINMPVLDMNGDGDVDMLNREYYGWVGNTGTSFTLTKGATTHTYNRVPSTTTYAPTVPISGTIVWDESDPWTMTWDTGSCLVAVRKSFG